jgi:hypothetical protein
MAGVRFTDLQSRQLEFLDLDVFQMCTLSFEFIPIKSLAAMGSSAPGSCVRHSTVPSRDHGRPPSTDGSGLSQCDNASRYHLTGCEHLSDR